MPEDEKTKDDRELEADKADEDATDWKAEADKWKALARKHETQSKANADAARKLAELEERDKTEAQKAADRAAEAEDRAKKAEADLLRLRVGIRKGLTETQAKRLVGDTEEELEADADDLVASFKASDGDDEKNKEAPSGRPRERLRPGAAPDEEPETTDPRKLAELIPRG